MSTFASLCTGIGGFDLGFERAGMRCVFQCEQEPNCNVILERHWPDVPRTKDVNCDETAEQLIRLRPDWLCFGFPCQDLSVAGSRAGLAGERSGLFFRCAKLASLCGAGGVVIENVPGLLSSNDGRDMGIVLSTLGDMGYRWSYRVLDSQWFGLAQRRKRVFIVGSLGDGRCSEILFESEGVLWDSAPRRETGTRVAARVASCLNSGGNAGGFRSEPGEHLVTSRALSTSQERLDADTETFVVTHADVHPCLRGGNRHNNSDATMEAQMLVTHALTAEGHDASEDGTGRGVPLVTTFQADEYANGSFEQLDCARPMTISPDRSRAAPIVVGGFKGGQGAKAHSDGYAVEQAQTLVASNSGTQGSPKCHVGSSVRRLTEVECERLQGFPDDFTAGLSGSARYRALGNAVSVPVAEWIGRRIVKADT